MWKQLTHEYIATFAATLPLVEFTIQIGRSLRRGDFGFFFGIDTFAVGINRLRTERHFHRTIFTLHNRIG